ncbi:MAG: hypothetical protein K9K32_07120 [Halanaerobiales bacterium]|nr:hypothetical protein [Halanaerobiales bacterium]
MQVEGSVKPDSYEIKTIENGMAIVLLRKNISEKTIENEDGSTDTLYEYDEVEVELIERNNLESYIENNFDMIFQAGVEEENTPNEPSIKERLEAVEEAIVESVGI